jgi:hypothetical protein
MWGEGESRGISPLMLNLGRAPESVWMILRRQKFLAFTEVRTPDRPVRTSVTISVRYSGSPVSSDDELSWTLLCSVFWIVADGSRTCRDRRCVRAGLNQTCWQAVPTDAYGRRQFGWTRLCLRYVYYCAGAQPVFSTGGGGGGGGGGGYKKKKI